MNLVFLGPPGVGKGTQARVLAGQFGLTAVATGDLIRAEVVAGTPLGCEAKKYIEAGNLVPDDVIIKMVEDLLARDNRQGFLLDGFPRTIAQAEGLERMGESPIIEIRKLIELYLFSYLIGNGDLHAKNISLLQEEEGGRICFSPCYDLLSTLPYGDRTAALRIGAKDDNFTATDFIEFGEQFGIPEKAIRALISRLLERAHPWMSKVDEIGLAAKKTADLVRTFEQRRKKLEML